MIKINKSQQKTYKFGDIASNISERAEPKETKLDIYVGLEHLDPDCIHIKRKGHPSDVKGTKLRVYPGDIIFGKRRAYQRKAAIVDFDGICSAHAMVVRANPKVILPKLLPFFMHSDAFMHRAVDVSEGSLSPTIKWKILADQEFKIPSLDDQKPIADLLWSIDSSIESYGHVMQKLKVSLYTFMDHLIKKPSANSIRLGDFVSAEKGLTYGSDDYGDDKNGEILINLKCFERFGGFNKSGIKFYKGKYEEKHILKPGELIIANTDITRDGNVVGYPVIVPDFGNKIVLFTMDVSRLKIKDKNKMLPDYLFYLLRTNWAHGYMFAHSPGTTVLHLDVSAVDELPIPDIDVGVQRDIVCKLSMIEKNGRKIEDLIKKAGKIQKQIINQIFG